MTEQIKSAIDIMENEMPHCGEKLVYTEEERAEAYTLAIRSLQAWEEVLQELEHDKEICFAHDSDEGFVYARAIDIINRHLEIEE